MEMVQSAPEKFKNLRDQRLAHVDVAKAGQTYELKKAPGPEWGVDKEAVQRLICIAELLLTILQKKDESFGQFVELARRDARDFWGNLIVFIGAIVTRSMNDLELIANQIGVRSAGTPNDRNTKWPE